MRKRKPPKPRLEGAYIVKAAESYPSRPEPKLPPPGYAAPEPTAEDRALARAVLRAALTEEDR